jgi:hypothetical protein
LFLDELLQSAPQLRRHFAVAAAMTARHCDRLTVRSYEIEAPRTIAEMLVEPMFHFGVERSLGVVEEKALNITAAKPCAEELPEAIHSNSRCWWKVG